MEFKLNDLQTKYKQMKTPQAPLAKDHQQTENKNLPEETMNQFITNLKNIDHESKKVLKRVYISYLFLATVLTGLFIFNPGESVKTLSRVGWGTLAVSFSFFTLSFRRGYFWLKEINYDEPALEFLTRTQKRLGFVDRSTWVYFGLSVLTVNAGLFMILYAYVFATGTEGMLFIIGIQLLVNALFAGGFGIGYLTTSLKIKPIIKELNALKEALLEDNGSSTTP